MTAAEFATFLTVDLVPREWCVVYRREGCEAQVAEPLTLAEAQEWLVALLPYENVVWASIERLAPSPPARAAALGRSDEPTSGGAWSE